MSVEQPNQEPSKEKRRSTRGQRGAFLASWLARRTGNEIKDSRPEQDEDHEKGGFRHRFKYLWSKLFTAIGATEQIGETKPEIIVASRKRDDQKFNKDEAVKVPDENDELAQVSNEYKGELIVNHNDEKVDQNQAAANQQISNLNETAKTEPAEAAALATPSQPDTDEDAAVKPGAPIVPLSIAEMSQLSNPLNIKEYNPDLSQPTQPLSISKILEQRQKLDLASLPPYFKLGYPNGVRVQANPPVAKKREYVNPGPLNGNAKTPASEPANTELILPEPSVSNPRKEGFIEPATDKNVPAAPPLEKAPETVLEDEAMAARANEPIERLYERSHEIKDEDAPSLSGAATPLSAILASRPAANINSQPASQTTPAKPAPVPTATAPAQETIKEPMPFAIMQTPKTEEKTAEPEEKIHNITPPRPEPAPLWQLPNQQAEDDRYRRAIINGFWGGIVVVFITTVIYLFN